MSFNPKRRYSAVAVLSEDLDRVVLIHKLRPSWQAGKANLPGGKVEDAKDWQCEYHPANWISHCKCSKSQQPGWEDIDHRDTDPDTMAYLRCARRELAEETGLVVDASSLKLFCRLRFKSREGDDAECCFYAVKGDVEAARTMEAEEVFCTDVVHVLRGTAHIRRTWHDYWVPTMPNLPYLIAMARQCLRGDDTATWPLTVYENGATS